MQQNSHTEAAGWIAFMPAPFQQVYGKTGKKKPKRKNINTMIENIERIGNFTSSEIHKLMSNGKAAGSIGKPYYTYIEEKILERRLGRSVDTEAYSRPMAWGTFLEKRVFDLLEFGFELVSKETKLHPSIPHWSGSTDLIMPGVKIAEIKCYQPKAFAQYSDCLLDKDPERLKYEFPEEYWQLVSNAIINGVSKAEALAYMPYRSELPIIRQMVAEYTNEDDEWQFNWIAEADDTALAYLPDDNGYYKNLNRFEFVVPQCDIDFLTDRVKSAGALLTAPVQMKPQAAPTDTKIILTKLKTA